MSGYTSINIRSHTTVERLRAETGIPSSEKSRYVHLRIFGIKDGAAHKVAFSFEDSPYARAVATRVADVIEEESARWGLTPVRPD